MPQSIITGLASGASSVAGGVVLGVGGMAALPVAGFKKGGVAGGVGGVVAGVAMLGIGVVGGVAKGGYDVVAGTINTPGTTS